jgi:Ser/Thr protein kinase RdoA (MazF antagonist)
VEQGWNRATDPVALSNTEAQAMLAPLSVTLRSLALLSAGLANTNFRCEIEGREPVVLRLYTRNPLAAATEAALLRLVRDGVPVPEVLLSRPDTEQPYAVISSIEGTLMQDVLPGADGAQQHAIGRAAGEMLARIQQYRFGAPGFFAEDGSLIPSGALPPFAGHIAACLLRDGGAANLGPDLTQRILRHVDDNEALLSDDGRYVLVHGDYKASNLLLSGAGDKTRISGVLDWEFAFSGPTLFDLTMLLRHSDAMPSFERGVVESYRAAGGFLERGWKQRVRLLDFANVCQFAAGNPNEARIRDVRMLIEATLDSWQAYAEA